MIRSVDAGSPGRSCRLRRTPGRTGCRPGGGHRPSCPRRPFRDRAEADRHRGQTSTVFPASHDESSCLPSAALKASKLHRNRLARPDSHTVADDQIGEGLLGLVGGRRNRHHGCVGGIGLRDDCDDIDDERQRVARLDHIGRRRRIAVRQIGWNVELAATAALIPTRPSSQPLITCPPADGDREGSASVVAVVELGAVGGAHADVVNHHRVPR